MISQTAKTISISLFSLFFITLLASCASLNSTESESRINYPFCGDWQGQGSDSEGNEFTFFATVIDLEDCNYRILFFARLDATEPMHIMDGVLKNNEITSTADDGVYEGHGVLEADLFRGSYQGPVDGTYTMWRRE